MARRPRNTEAEAQRNAAFEEAVKLRDIKRRYFAKKELLELFETDEEAANNRYASPLRDAILDPNYVTTEECELVGLDPFVDVN